MALILAPIPPAKLDAWKKFIGDMMGPRKAEFVDFNKRHQLTKHDAWLCATPAGHFVAAIHEGPGAATLMPSVAKSSHAFDKYFASQLAEIHGMDVSKPPPGPMPERLLTWSA